MLVNTTDVHCMSYQTDTTFSPRISDARVGFINREEDCDTG